MGTDAKGLWSRAAALRDRLARMLDTVAERRGEAAASLHDLRAESVARQLVEMPIARLRDVTEDRLRISPLVDAGYTTVFDVFRATLDELDAVPNVGATTAAQIHAAAVRIAHAVQRATPVRLDPDARSGPATTVLRQVDRYERARRASAPLRADGPELNARLDALLVAAKPARSRVRMAFTFGAKKRAANDAVIALQRLLDAPATTTTVARLDAAERAVLDAGDPSADALWRAYETNAASFAAAVEQLDDTPRPAVDRAHGYAPAEIVDAINALELDEAYLQVSLRGYQEFGAKFALTQERAILGDEMGLGKTIQAIAALAHLQAQGHAHFLVVCPATVLVNWVHEVAKHSDLVAHRVHGDARDDVLGTWVREGGVAVTTFETLRGLALPDDLDLAMVVVDEAHYVKNADTLRSRAVRSVAQRAARTLFLTGTPMENRVEEFRTLVAYLRPDIATSLDAAAGVAGADAFREAVAPVYLRRNQDDVLSELPERIDTEDWVELTADDLAAYRDAVVAGNFMAMRRAAFVAADVERSAKLGRLAEILADAAENGHKVVVFSFFLDVLETVRALAGADAHGPLTGATSPTERQALVDRFSAVDGYAVLVSQIQAGGVGLNIQAASVVVLTEPQWKPSSEEQAIARCHRMGQTRVVQVHRLLAEDSVDALLLDVVRAKTELFDDYARESELKEAAPEAVDVSGGAVTLAMIAAERARLAPTA